MCYCELDEVEIEANNNTFADAPDIDNMLWANNIKNNWVFATSGGTGGGAYPNVVIATPSVVVYEPDTPIADLTDFFECFDATQDAVVTIYTTEPNPGSGDANVGRYCGHTFVSISQGANTSVFGYYPISNWISPWNTSGPAVLGDDGSGNENFTACISTTITGVQLQQIINASTNFTPTYDLNNYNCTDFGIDIGNLSGLGLPAANGTWLGGNGLNPGALGLYIRNLTPPAGVTTNTAAGNAPATNKGC